MTQGFDSTRHFPSDGIRSVFRLEENDFVESRTKPGAASAVNCSG